MRQFGLIISSRGVERVTSLHAGPVEIERLLEFLTFIQPEIDRFHEMIRATMLQLRLDRGRWGLEPGRPSTGSAPTWLLAELDEEERTLEAEMRGLFRGDGMPLIHRT